MLLKLSSIIPVIWFLTFELKAENEYFCSEINNLQLNSQNYIRAVSNGCNKFFDRYIIAGHDINAQSSEGISALTLAILLQRDNFVDKLLGAGADVKNVGKMGPLEAAVRHGNLAMVQKLLIKWADPNKVNGIGLTPMQEATMFIDTRALELLMKYRGQLKPQDAQFSLTLPVLKFYESQGTNLKSVDHDQKTLLHHAADYCDIPIADKGLEVIMPDEERRQHCNDVIAYLLSVGVDSNAKDIYGKKAIDYGAKINNEAMKKMLREAMRNKSK